MMSTIKHRGCGSISDAAHKCRVSENSW